MVQKIRLIIVLSLAALVLSGCLLFGPGPDTSTVGTISLQFIISPGSVEYCKANGITMGQFNAAAKKAGSNITKDFQQAAITGETLLANLGVGRWEINVAIKDSQGYALFNGTVVADVSANTVTKASMPLLLAKGNLNVQITIPTGAGVTSGKVILENPTIGLASITQNLFISGSSGTASIYALESSSWIVTIKLYNAQNVEVAYGSSNVNILPSRTATALADVNVIDGSIDVTIGWDTDPTPPTGLSAVAAGTGIQVSWTASPSANVVGYLIYRSTSVDGEKEYLNSSLIAETVYVDTTVEPGNTYWYWVQAFNEQGYSSNLSEPCSVSF